MDRQDRIGNLTRIGSARSAATKNCKIFITRFFNAKWKPIKTCVSTAITTRECHIHSRKAKDLDGKMNRMWQETVRNNTYKFRGAIFAVSVSLFFICFLLMPRTNSMAQKGEFHRRLRVKFPSTSTPQSERYVVIFDAGSSGSRVYVFRFDQNMGLLPIGDGGDLEFVQRIRPGLSSYAEQPQEAANSLKPLLEAAEAIVPARMRSTTPIWFGATAGLRLLPRNSSDSILQAVKGYFAANASLMFKHEWVNVLDGAQEGSFQWITVNYLLGNIGKNYSATVGTVDLGGGSVQMAYAISKDAAKNAPKPEKGQDPYVKGVKVIGRKYHVYVHSYLFYGMLAARAEILNVTKTDSPCILKGFQGVYNYSGAEYRASAPSRGSDFEKCRGVVDRALKIEEACRHPNCSFGGVWNGGGGDGQKRLFVASFFFDRAVQAGFVDPNVTVAGVKPADFKKAAERACGTAYGSAGKEFPSLEEDQWPYICMDLTYQYALLADGFGLGDMQEFILVRQIKHKNYLVGATWPLGSAIELVSSMRNRLP